LLKDIYILPFQSEKSKRRRREKKKEHGKWEKIKKKCGTKVPKGTDATSLVKRSVSLPRSVT
jgi:hypothetical protein